MPSALFLGCFSFSKCDFDSFWLKSSIEGAPNRFQRGRSANDPLVLVYFGTAILKVFNAKIYNNKLFYDIDGEKMIIIIVIYTLRSESRPTLEQSLHSRTSFRRC